MSGSLCRQRGQALVFATVTLAVILLGLLYVFNVSQLTSTRMDLQNTADATAYSISSIAARDYNFTAYMNRAMVANQVTMGQIVGLASWNNYVESAVDKITIVCEFIPGLDVVCDAIDEAVHEYSDVFADTVTPTVVKALSFWNKALSVAENAMHIGTVEAILQNVLPKTKGLQAGVLYRNDPDARFVKAFNSFDNATEDLSRLAMLLYGTKQWWGLSHKYKPPSWKKNSGLKRFTEVVQGSRDGFLKGKNVHDKYKVTRAEIRKKVEDWVESLIPKWLKKLGVGWVVKKFVDAAFKLIPISGLEAKYLRLGATEFQPNSTKLFPKSDNVVWSSVNTSEVQLTITFPSLGFCLLPPGISPTSKWCITAVSWQPPDFTLPGPIGSGAAIANPGGTAKDEDIYVEEGAKGLYNRAAKDTLVSFALAITAYSSFIDQGGLQPYRGIDKPGEHKDDLGPAFMILVSKPASTVKTTSRMDIGSGDLKLEDPKEVTDIYALAKGRLRFGRAGEYSNFFNPYWEATLADTNDTERCLVLTAIHPGLACAGL